MNSIYLNIATVAVDVITAATAGGLACLLIHRRRERCPSEVPNVMWPTNANHLFRNYDEIGAQIAWRHGRPELGPMIAKRLRQVATMQDRATQMRMAVDR